MKLARLALVLAAVVVLAFDGVLTYSELRAPAPVVAPAPASFDKQTVRRGAELAALGNCNVCHMAPGGRAFAGGLGIATPFGTIYSSNITPDQDTGIGQWSLAAFTRAMQEGLDRNGRHLYPAFPYNHFTYVSDADDAAIYAYLMTRQPVHATPPANDLPFPLNIRATLVGWNLLFFTDGPLKPDAGKSAAWNRGAYLAEGLAHCGACHTPHNALGAEEHDKHFAGAPIEGWYAYAINDASPAPIPWTQASLASYLKQGWAEHHGIARGPMAAVTENMATLPDADIEDIATYVVDRMGAPSAARQGRAEALLAGHAGEGGGGGGGAGQAIYEGACATCHQFGRPLPFGGMNLAYSTAMYGASPQNVINMVLDGLPAAGGEPAPIMPGFRGTLNQAQLTDLLTYLRAAFSDRPAWAGVDAMARTSLARRQKVGSRPTESVPTESVRGSPAETPRTGSNGGS